MWHPKFALPLALVLAVSLAACGDSRIVGVTSNGPALPPVAQPELAKCVMQSPFLAVGEGLDAPGRLEMPVAVMKPTPSPSRS